MLLPGGVGSLLEVAERAEEKRFSSKRVKGDLAGETIVRIFSGGETTEHFILAHP